MQCSRLFFMITSPNLSIIDKSIIMFPTFRQRCHATLKCFYHSLCGRIQAMFSLQKKNNNNNNDEDNTQTLLNENIKIHDILAKRTLNGLQEAFLRFLQILLS